MPWTALPDAAKLLASLAAEPAPQRYVTGIFGPNDGVLIHDDERVKALRSIHRHEGDRIWSKCVEARDYASYEAHCRLSVDTAIQVRSRMLLPLWNGERHEKDGNDRRDADGYDGRSKRGSRLVHAAE